MVLLHKPFKGWSKIEPLSLYYMTRMRTITTIMIISAVWRVLRAGEEGRFISLYIWFHTHKGCYLSKERTTESRAYRYFHAQIDYQSGHEHAQISRRIWAHVHNFEIRMNLCCSEEKKEENYYLIKALWLFRKTDWGSQIYGYVVNHKQHRSKMHFTLSFTSISPLAILL